jgi:hypothetical protein
VSIKIGMFPACRKRWQAARPSSPGIITSKMIKSNSADASLLSISAVLSAADVLIPFRSKYRATDFRIST